MFELSQIRCFVAVAEELHFGRAAARLNMTQPPLSRQIQILEHALGAKLFERTNRRVNLTIPGQTFLPEAIRLLRLASGAAANVRRAAAGEIGNVTIGFTTTSSYDFLPRALRRIHAAASDMHVTLREATTTALIEALSAGDIDLALIRPTSPLTTLPTKILQREPLLLAVSTDHKLARVETFTADDLHGEKFVGYSPDGMRYFHDLLARLLSLQNPEVEIVQQVAQVHSVLALVRAGLGVGVVPASARHLRFDGVEFKNFAGTQRLQAELTLAWRGDDANAAVDRVRRVLLAMDDHAGTRQSL